MNHNGFRDIACFLDLAGGLLKGPLLSRNNNPGSAGLAGLAGLAGPAGLAGLAGRSRVL